MSKLYEDYQRKREVLDGLKKLFYGDQEKFKRYFHEQNINEQARLLAFLQVNDSKFYKEVEEYTGGCKLLW